jgi:SHAQKYF class myb-like DNA-binding protein
VASVIETESQQSSEVEIIASQHDSYKRMKTEFKEDSDALSMSSGERQSESVDVDVQLECISTGSNGKNLVTNG